MSADDVDPAITNPTGYYVTPPAHLQNDRAIV
jgi:hypothetical protein